MKETIFYKRDLLFQGADGPYSAAVRVFIDRCGMYVYVYKRDLDIWKETSKSEKTYKRDLDIWKETSSCSRVY